jgi:hypothetical protein
MLYDPLFWQALGKAYGWGTDAINVSWNIKGKDMGTWLYNWHSFIDHLAEGKDADSFFKELINSKMKGN